MPPGKRPIIIDVDPQSGSHTVRDDAARAGGHPWRTAETADLEWLARWMDSAFEIPGANVRFGFDALFGLVPGLGDTATSLVSLYILLRARQAGISRITMTRMAANIAVDYIVGSVPFAGDLFDIYWKANQKNVTLLQRHLETSPQQRKKLQWQDWLFFLALAGGLLLLLAGSVAVAYFLIALLGQAWSSHQP